MTSNKYWKMQFLCHPLILFGLLYLASIHHHEPASNREEDSTTPTTLSWSSTSHHYSLLLVPFAFNFGVEPFQWPTDFMFLFFFYLHHLAPVLACMVVEDYNRRNNNNDYDDYYMQWFGLAQALLFGHAWAMHPIAYWNQKKILDKQSLFWPYIMSGFILMMFWWYPVIRMMMMMKFNGEDDTMETNNNNNNNNATNHNQEFLTTILLPLVLPTLFQYIGRWGLYLRICWMEGWYKPTHVMYDAFEWRKQYYELTCWILSYIICAVVVIVVPF